MNDMEISFPNLGITLPYVPKSFTIFGIEIALYGLIITLGMLLAVALSARLADREELKGEEVWNASLWCIVLSIVGARIYYVLFSWDAYRGDLLQIFNLRAGGLAFYGGLIAAAATLLFYVKKKQLSFPRYADVMVHGILLGQSIGRWGNFTNREAFGGYTEGLFAMRLPLSMVRGSDITQEIALHVESGMNYIQVHPTFLYESAWNLCLLLLLLWYSKKKLSRFAGERMLMYLGGYGLGRFLIEGLRTDQLRFPGTEIAVSQVLGGALFVCATALMLYFRGRKGAAIAAEAESAEEEKEDANIAEQEAERLTETDTETETQEETK